MASSQRLLRRLLVLDRFSLGVRTDTLALALALVLALALALALTLTLTLTLGSLSHHEFTRSNLAPRAPLSSD